MKVIVLRLITRPWNACGVAICSMVRTLAENTVLNSPTATSTTTESTKDCDSANTVKVAR